MDGQCLDNFRYKICSDDFWGLLFLGSGRSYSFQTRWVGGAQSNFGFVVVTWGCLPWGLLGVFLVLGSDTGSHGA